MEYDRRNGELGDVREERSCQMDEFDVRDYSASAALHHLAGLFSVGGPRVQGRVRAARPEVGAIQRASLRSHIAFPSAQVCADPKLGADATGLSTMVEAFADWLEGE